MTTHALENLCQQAVDEAEQWREAAEEVGPEQLEQAREEAFQVHELCHSFIVNSILLCIALSCSVTALYYLLVLRILTALSMWWLDFPRMFSTSECVCL